MKPVVICLFLLAVSQPVLADFSGVIYCPLAVFTWDGGKAPYSLSIVTGDPSSLVILKDFGLQAETYFRWRANIFPNDPVAFVVRDSIGDIAKSCPFMISANCSKPSPGRPNPTHTHAIAGYNGCIARSGIAEGCFGCLNHFVSISCSANSTSKSIQGPAFNFHVPNITNKPTSTFPSNHKTFRPNTTPSPPGTYSSPSKHAGSTGSTSPSATSPASSPITSICATASRHSVSSSTSTLSTFSLSSSSSLIGLGVSSTSCTSTISSFASSTNSAIPSSTGSWTTTASASPLTTTPPSSPIESQLRDIKRGIIGLAGGFIAVVFFATIYYSLGRSHSNPTQVAPAQTSAPFANRLGTPTSTTIPLEPMGSSVRLGSSVFSGSVGAQVDARGMNMHDIGRDQYNHATGNSTHYNFNLFVCGAGSAHRNSDLDAVNPVQPLRAREF